MREIKFRLYCKQNSKFIDQRQFCIDGYGDIFIMGITGGLVRASRSRFIAMQYSGLEDCKGNDIYEGDILFTNIMVPKTWYTVVFDDGSFCKKYRDDVLLRPMNSGDHMLREIISNIYERPDFL